MATVCNDVAKLATAVARQVAPTLVPLAVLGAYSAVDAETVLWREVLDEVGGGQERAVRTHVDAVLAQLQAALAAPAWSLRQQAAMALTAATGVVGADVLQPRGPELLGLLQAALTGRTYPGKEAVVATLAKLAVQLAPTLPATGPMHARNDASAPAPAGDGVNSPDDALSGSGDGSAAHGGVLAASWASVVATLVAETSRRDVRYRRSALEALTSVLRARRGGDDVFAALVPTAEAVLGGPAPATIEAALHAGTSAAATERRDNQDDDDDDGPLGRPARLTLAASMLTTLAAALPHVDAAQGAALSWGR